MKNWENVTIVPEFFDQGVNCYKVVNEDYLNEYYIVSEPETRKLMSFPEVVGYDVYRSMVNSTGQMMYYLKEKNKLTSANILAILRGALNFPVEEACWKEHIRVHDISFLSCERVIENGVITGLDVKYNKMAVVPDSTLMIGDIIASGETLIYCMKEVIEIYRKKNAKLRNIVMFTIGAKKGIELLENFTAEIREFWPDFEGFITVYYEGIFNCYQPGDKGISGVNRANIDFIWRGGIVSPEFRRHTLSMQNPLFEKCTIYDGGARRYEISEHIEEVLEFWEGIKANGKNFTMHQLLEEKLGHEIPISYENWVKVNHYQDLHERQNRFLYQQELGFIESVKDLTIEEIADQRIKEFSHELRKYMK